MKLLIDTNRYSDLDRGDADALSVISAAQSACLPFIVLAELHSGFRGGTKRAENERRLNRFLEQPGFSVLYADYQTIDLYADLRTQLNRSGKTIPVHDIWIAALALQHSLTLYARDKHFDYLPQLIRV